LCDLRHEREEGEGHYQAAREKNQHSQVVFSLLAITVIRTTIALLAPLSLSLVFRIVYTHLVLLNVKARKGIKKPVTAVESPMSLWE